MQGDPVALRRLVVALEMQQKQAFQALQNTDRELSSVNKELADLLVTADVDGGLGPLMVVHSVRKLSTLSKKRHDLDARRVRDEKSVTVADVRLRLARDMLRQARYKSEAVKLERAVAEIVERRAVSKRSRLT